MLAILNVEDERANERLAVLLARQPVPSRRPLATGDAARQPSSQVQRQLPVGGSPYGARWTSDFAQDTRKQADRPKLWMSRSGFNKCTTDGQR
jgi:hypothetical protein